MTQIICHTGCFFKPFTTGHLYGRANLLAFLAQDAVCAVGLGNKATATSCGIQDQRAWQKVSGSEQASAAVMSVEFKRLVRAEEPVCSNFPPGLGGTEGGSGALENAHSTYFSHTL